MMKPPDGEGSPHSDIQQVLCSLFSLKSSSNEWNYVDIVTEINPVNDAEIPLNLVSVFAVRILLA